MSRFTKILLIGFTALTAVAAHASPDSDRRARNAEEVLAAHRQVPALTPIAHRMVRHHHHHRHHHPVRHVR